MPDNRRPSPVDGGPRYVVLFSFLFFFASTIFVDTSIPVTFPLARSVGSLASSQYTAGLWFRKKLVTEHVQLSIFMSPR